MKRLIYISLFCIVQTAWGMDALWIDEEDQISISPFTNAVHQRYYYIARLEPVHDLIEKLHCSCIITYQEFKALSYIQPQHARIIYCINTMQDNQSCVPLLELWQELCSYKYLADQEFMKEYTSLVCIVANQLVTLMHEQLSLEEQKTLSSVINRASTGNTTISSYDIAYRYYMVKRLKRVGNLLKHCATMPCKYAIYEYLPHCSDMRIVNCAQDIDTKGSLEPLIQLCNDLEQYQSVDDAQFIHELLELIVIVEQHALAPMYLPRQRELCAHYEYDIEGLSVEELLKSIDILTAHIEPYAFTEKHQLDQFPSLSTLAAVACGSIATWYALQKLGVTQ